MNTEGTNGNRSDMIVCENVDKWFGDFQALKGVTATIAEQEVVVVLGPSGSGKSTWIRCINRLEAHQKGTIVVDGVELTNDLRNIEKIRSEVGMVFQQFNLFPHLTVLDNVTLAPKWVRKMPKAAAEERAEDLLEMVGIPEQAAKYPGQLSGGQQQRVAIARAIINQPSLLLADEPTGALDSKTTEDVLNLFDQLHNQGITIVLVTHEDNVAQRAKKIARFKDGKVIEISQN